MKQTLPTWSVANLRNADDVDVVVRDWPTAAYESADGWAAPAERVARCAVSPLGCDALRWGAALRTSTVPPMRVVAGTARGRTIDAPPGKNTRPTSDRVRESIFNALGSLDLVVDATVLDLFAGSGALGIEALSRGAARATFVESDRRAVRVIEDNLARCGFADRATVVTADVTRFMSRRASFDLALADPPYAFDSWTDVLADVDAETLVIESDRAVPVTSRWDVVRDRTYGSTVVQIVTRAHPEPARSPQE